MKRLNPSAIRSAIEFVHVFHVVSGKNGSPLTRIAPLPTVAAVEPARGAVVTISGVVNGRFHSSMSCSQR